LSAFPPQMAYICQHPDANKYDLSSIRTIITGGSVINPTFEQQLFDKLPNLRAFVIVLQSFLLYYMVRMLMLKAAHTHAVNLLEKKNTSVGLIIVTLKRMFQMRRGNGISFRILSIINIICSSTCHQLDFGL